MQAVNSPIEGQKRDMPESPPLGDPHNSDFLMLVRQRKSRIYFLRRFFEYPIQITISTVGKFGRSAHDSLRLQLPAFSDSTPARGEVA